MIGVFDSGAGGLFALAELRRLSPTADIAYFADRKNAPYGTKSQEQLISLVMEDIERLVLAGCDKVLMACCTASTVHSLLPEEYRAVAVPIISPAAREAALLSRNGRIGVLSTEATKRSGAFTEQIKKHSAGVQVMCLAAPELVSLAESGERDGMLSEGGVIAIEKSVSGFLHSGIDTLILGCTHFAYFENKIKDILRVEAVNSARVGAKLMQKYASEGDGVTVYL